MENAHCATPAYTTLHCGAHGVDHIITYSFGELVQRHSDDNARTDACQCVIHQCKKVLFDTFLLCTAQSTLIERHLHLAHMFYECKHSPRRCWQAYFWNIQTSGKVFAMPSSMTPQTGATLPGQISEQSPTLSASVAQ